MDISTLLDALAFGFAVTTVLTVLGMAAGGLVLAFYIAVPSAQAWLDRRLYSKQERAHMKAMAEIDREYERRLKDIRRKTRPVIYVEY